MKYNWEAMVDRADHLRKEARENMNTPEVGDRLTVIDGSSDGHTGTIVAIKSKTCVRIKRDADGVEVDVSNFSVHNKLPWPLPWYDHASNS